MKLLARDWLCRPEGSTDLSEERVRHFLLLLLVILGCILVGTFVIFVYRGWKAKAQLPAVEAVSDEEDGSGCRPGFRGSYTSTLGGPERTLDDIRDALIACSSQDLFSLLHALGQARGKEILIEAAASVEGISARRASVGSSIMLGSWGGNLAVGLSPRPAEVSPPVVHFFSHQNYGEEGQTMAIRVARAGDLRRPSKVNYKTCDSSAKAGVNYAPQEGALFFQAGEQQVLIHVPLLENELYGPSSEFRVELLQDGLENAILSPDLWQTWVQIMDNDAFPTNTYKEDIDAGLLKEVPATSLLWQYVKFSWMDPVVQRGIIKILVTDQFENLYGLLNLIMSVYIVDFVVRTSVPESRLFLVQDRTASLVMITAAMVVPFFLFHGLNYRKASWKVAGTCKATLQTALLRKFLDYQEDVRSALSHGDLIMATTHDAFNLVENGLLKILDFVRMLGSILVLITFQFTAPWIFNRPFRLWVVMLIIILPALMSVFARLRLDITTACLSKVHSFEARLAEHVHETVLHYPIIADYNQRPYFVEKYEHLIEASNTAGVHAQYVLTNNAYYAVWLAALATAGFTFLGGLLVIQGNMTLGMFLANIKIFQSVGDISKDIYKTWLEIQQVIPSLTRITRLLNLDIDVDERKAVNDYFQEKCSELVLKEQGADLAMPMDALPVVVNELDVCFLMRKKPITFHNRLEIQQGCFYSVIGSAGQGKSTFLKVLGGAILSSNLKGLVIPPHLRVLHVQPEPMFFHGTLMDNLTFGLAGGIRVGSKADQDEHVFRVCRRLGISEETMAQVKSDDIFQWDVVLPSTQKGLLNLARAFISCPDLLLVDQPLEHLNERRMTVILELLREFVQERGIEQDDLLHPRALRRPRTCIVTTSKRRCVDACDKVIHIPHDGKLSYLDKDTISADMLA